MRKLLALLLAAALTCACLPVSAAGRVTYSGKAGDIVF